MVLIKMNQNLICPPGRLHQQQAAKWRSFQFSFISPGFIAMTVCVFWKVRSNGKKPNNHALFFFTIFHHFFITISCVFSEWLLWNRKDDLSGSQKGKTNWGPRLCHSLSVGLTPRGILWEAYSMEAATSNYQQSFCDILEKITLQQCSLYFMVKKSHPAFH